MLNMTPKELEDAIAHQKLVDKIKDLPIFKPPVQLVGKMQDLRKVGSIFGVKLVVNMTDVPDDEKDDKYYKIRHAYEETLGIKLKAHGDQEKR